MEGSEQTKEATEELVFEEVSPESFNVSPEQLENETRLQNKFGLWYMKRGSGSKTESYEKSIKNIANFETIEGFWRVYNHMIRPNDLPTTTDYHLFKHGIKPMWEDPGNRKGGKWMIRLRKGIASLYWEKIILAIIGEQLDGGSEVCGAVISIRYNEDILSIWNRNADDGEACYRLRDSMRKVLQLPNFLSLEYKRHDASLSDNSSFRNTVVWRSGNNRSNSNTRRDNKEGRHHHNSRDKWSRENKGKDKGRRRGDSQDNDDGWKRV